MSSPALDCLPNELSERITSCLSLDEVYGSQIGLQPIKPPKTHSGHVFEANMSTSRDKVWKV